MYEYDDDGDDNQDYLLHDDDDDDDEGSNSNSSFSSDTIHHDFSSPYTCTTFSNSLTARSRSFTRSLIYK